MTASRKLDTAPLSARGPILHAIAIQPVESTLWATAGGKRAAAVRWRCSCGRVGPDVLERERHRAVKGGARHVAIAANGAR